MHAVARIPTLAPHFGVGMLGQNNKETQAVPIIGLDNSDLDATSEPKPAKPLGPAGSFAATQPPKRAVHPHAHPAPAGRTRRACGRPADRRGAVLAVRRERYGVGHVVL